jgi:hypothetical protein
MDDDGLDAVALCASVTVDIDDLYDNGATKSTNVEDTELALVVRYDKEVGQSVSKRAPLDLQTVDFVGPAEVVKRLFTLPYDDGQPLFAFHKIGNTLLLDSVTGHDTNPLASSSSNGNGGSSTSTSSYGNVMDTNPSLIGDAARPALTLDLRSTISSDVSIYQPGSVTPRSTGERTITISDAPEDAVDALDTSSTGFSSPFVPPPNYFMPPVPPPAK